MNPVYVMEQGAVIRRSSRSLVVTKDDSRILQIPVIKIDRLLVFGQVQLTTQAIELLLEEGIDVSFLSASGRLRGQLMAAVSKNNILRLSQYERANNEQFLVMTARSIVQGKILNGRALLRRYSRNHPESEYTKELEIIESVLDGLLRYKSVARLMGCEGVASAAYFRAFGRMFRRDLQFAERSRRPPKDPVNALLSLGYTMLTNEILSLVVAHGLDPYLGFLHGIVYGRPSLALDLVEEFRHPVIDRMTLNLINNKVLESGDFVKTDEGGFVLQPASLRRYFEFYENRMHEPEGRKKSGVTETIRDIARGQVRKMASAIKNGTHYAPYRFEG